MEISTADVPVILQGSVGTLERWLNVRSLLRPGVGSDLVGNPSLTTAWDLVASADPIIHIYSLVAAKAAPGWELSVGPALHMDLAAICASGWIRSAGSVQRDVAVGLAARVREILSSRVDAGGVVTKYDSSALHPSADVQTVRLSDIALAYVGAAALDQWSAEHAEHNYQLKLERIKTGLRLRVSELAKLLGVTREAIRQWYAGARISPDRWGDIDRLNGLVAELQRYFRPEALPGQIRRKIPAFDGMTGLQVIQAGRDAELLIRYRRVFEGDITQ
jgi:DNA-binding transcriptional regulator YiaG